LERRIISIIVEILFFAHRNCAKVEAYYTLTAYILAIMPVVVFRWAGYQVGCKRRVWYPEGK
jgi:hypothetical protein